MELSDAAPYTAIAGVVFTFLVMVASVIYRIGRLTQSVDDVKSTMLLYKESLQEQMEYHRTTLALQMQSLEERMNHNHEILRSDIQRLFDAMASHTHDTDGNIIFRVLPSSPQAEPESAPAD